METILKEKPEQSISVDQRMFTENDVPINKDLDIFIWNDNHNNNDNNNNSKRKINKNK